MTDFVMVGISRPTSASAKIDAGGVKGPPQERFAGPINWSCAFCGTLLVQGVSEWYAEHSLQCYRCGKFCRTPYPGEKR
jgi:hypothetical protein